MICKKIKKEELKQVVSIHKLAFKDFFLTTLGSRFLYLYYYCVMNSKKGVLIGIYEDNEIVGFCATAYKSKGFNSSLVKKNFSKFSGIALLLLFTKPLSLIRLFENFSKKSSSSKDDGNYAEVLSIATNPKVQGKGYGKTLILETENFLKRKNDIDCLSLTTDYYNNYKTIKFYEQMGFYVLSNFMAYPKRKMYRLIKTLDKNKNKL
ncbi:MAG: GNAT family N-acetyltransferase [Bacteroidetes bacterium]|nr:GNAT family N-acetyltransferase [Bacteroidota bacterium]